MYRIAHYYPQGCCHSNNGMLRWLTAALLLAFCWGELLCVVAAVPIAWRALSPRLLEKAAWKDELLFMPEEEEASIWLTC